MRSATATPNTRKYPALRLDRTQFTALRKVVTQEAHHNRNRLIFVPILTASPSSTQVPQILIKAKRVARLGRFRNRRRFCCSAPAFWPRACAKSAPPNSGGVHDLTARPAAANAAGDSSSRTIHTGSRDCQGIRTLESPGRMPTASYTRSAFRLTPLWASTSPMRG